jgi:hypothetical protein
LGFLEWCDSAVLAHFALPSGKRFEVFRLEVVDKDSELDVMAENWHRFGPDLL